MILLPFPAWNLTSCRNENWSKGKQLSRSLPNQSSLLPVTGLTGLLVFECSRCLYSPWPRESRTIKTLPRRSRNSFVYKFLHRIIRSLRRFIACQGFEGRFDRSSIRENYSRSKNTVQTKRKLQQSGQSLFVCFSWFFFYLFILLFCAPVINGYAPDSEVIDKRFFFFCCVW